MSYEGVGKTSSDCMTFSGSGLLLSSTDIPSCWSTEMSSCVTVIPRLPEMGVVRGVSSSYLYLNLYPPSSGGNTAEYMD